LDLVITKIVLEGSNIVVKNAANEIIKILPSQHTFANPDESKDGFIILNTVASLRDLYIENLPIKVSDVTIPAPPIGGWTVDLLLINLTANVINIQSSNTPLNPVYVNVVNQIDLTTVQNLLTDIKTFAQSINNNTDTLEAKLDTISASISSGNSVNHADLLIVIAELQLIEANTDGLEAQLTSIITNTTGKATEAKQDVGNASLASIDAKYTSVSRIPTAVAVLASVVGSTNAGVQMVSLRFQGTGGLLNGIAVANGTVATFISKANDTVGAISYRAPTSVNGTILITYLT